MRFLIFLLVMFMSCDDRYHPEIFVGEEDLPEEMDCLD